MKRILAMLLAVLMIFSMVSCAGTLEDTETETGEVKNTSESENKKTEENKEIVYPEGFSVGYGIVDITPTSAVPIYDGTADETSDPLMLTCTAVCDGKNVALLMSADLKGMEYTTAKKSFELIQKNFGIPEENVIINCTHTHSAHVAGENDVGVTRWASLYYKQLVKVVKEALQDLAPAEAYVSKGKTNGITFVRRYLMSNGKYQFNPSSGSGVVAHESEADTELRTVRFTREGKKDILMLNYQTHYGLYKKQFTADFVYYLRNWAAADLNANLVYYSGASGNLNFNSAIPGEKEGTTMDSVKKLWAFTKDALATEKKASTGPVKVASSFFEGTVRHDSEERVAQAREINNCAKGSSEQSSLVAKYGFSSYHEAWAVIVRAGLGETQEVYFNAISFGDIAFASAPYEMFDGNAKWVRDNSPFDTTFVCTLTNGRYGYIPTAEAFPHGSYEVDVCRFVSGTGERFAEEILRLVKLCK